MAPTGRVLVSSLDDGLNPVVDWQSSLELELRKILICSISTLCNFVSQQGLGGRMEDAKLLHASPKAVGVKPYRWRRKELTGK